MILMKLSAKHFVGFIVCCCVLIMPMLTMAQAQTTLDTKSYDQCAQDQRAITLAKLIINDEQQQRTELICHPLLASIAAEKAEEMAIKGDVNHFGLGGANQRLREGGYQLPRYYPGVGSNQVEAVAGGYGDPAELWTQFKKSKAHRSHLLGEHPFYREQYHIGIGVARREDSPHEYYWAVYIAKPKDSQQETLPDFLKKDTVPIKSEVGREIMDSKNKP
jgi:uncharacterized protein YkwD